MVLQYPLRGTYPWCHSIHSEVHTYPWCHSLHSEVQSPLRPVDTPLMYIHPSSDLPITASLHGSLFTHPFNTALPSCHYPQSPLYLSHLMHLSHSRVIPCIIISSTPTKGHMAVLNACVEGRLIHVCLPCADAADTGCEAPTVCTLRTPTVWFQTPI